MSVNIYYLGASPNTSLLFIGRGKGVIRVPMTHSIILTVKMCGECSRCVELCPECCPSDTISTSSQHNNNQNNTISPLQQQHLTSNQIRNKDWARGKTSQFSDRPLPLNYRPTVWTAIKTSNCLNLNNFQCWPVDVNVGGQSSAHDSHCIVIIMIVGEPWRAMESICLGGLQQVQVLPALSRVHTGLQTLYCFTLLLQTKLLHTGQQ